MEKVAVGLITFILVQQLVAALITGTSSGEIIISTVLALVVAFGVVMVALRTFLGGKGK